MRVSKSSPPGHEEHIAEARRNYEFYKRLFEEGTEPVWTVVVLFYSALHLVQAYAVKCNERCHSHEDRQIFLARRLNTIEAPYRRLRDEADRARYRLHRPSSKRIQSYHDEDYQEVLSEMKRRNIAWNEDETPPEA